MNAKQQLIKVDLRKVFGDSVKPENYRENVGDLIEITFSNLLDGEVADQLTDDQCERIENAFSREDITATEGISLLKEAVPNFDEMFREKLLENKQEAIKGRAVQLQEKFEDDEDMEDKLDNLEEAIEDEQWLKVQDIIVELTK